ncbi:MAG: hypothetical protein HYS26_01090 [Candidatus Kaiserbacteria bacterium]|nr:MAG: hypothetical protein HYS26_01090 [Candidatus Kaiserbacteria bacterium]
MKFTKPQFLVANHEVGPLVGAMSTAAAWIWAPALFLAAEKAYTQGWVGVFWFVVPNMATLVIFAFFAWKLRSLFPDGYTLSGCMRERYSGRVQNVYLTALIGLATCSFAVQLLAGAKVLSVLTGLPYWSLTIILAIIPVGYSLYSGFKGSMVSDSLQLLMIYAVGALIVPWTIIAGGGWETVEKGLYGKSGTFTDLFSGDGLTVFLTFGIPVTIGLLAGPFGDQSFWQRAFAIRKDSVRLAFILAAFIFGVVPITLSLLGFLGAGMGLTAVDTQRVNLEVVGNLVERKLLPGWILIMFVYLLLSGLVSTLDSNLTAISSLAGHDIAGRAGHGESLDRRGFSWFSRGAMLVLVVGGIAIANIPGMTIPYLFLFYGTLRASTLLPTVITILKKQVSEPGMFWGIITSIVIGLPIFAYGNLYKVTPMIIGGSLFSVLASGIIVLIATWRRRT